MIALVLSSVLFFQLMLTWLQQTSLAQANSANAAYWLPLCTTPVSGKQPQPNAPTQPLAGKHCVVCHIFGCQKPFLPGVQTVILEPDDAVLASITHSDTLFYPIAFFIAHPRGPPLMFS